MRHIMKAWVYWPGVEDKFDKLLVGGMVHNNDNDHNTNNDGGRVN